jgi:hypothetical protein
MPFILRYRRTTPPCAWSPYLPIISMLIICAPWTAISHSRSAKTAQALRRAFDRRAAGARASLAPSGACSPGWPRGRPEAGRARRGARRRADHLVPDDRPPRRCRAGRAAARRRGPPRLADPSHRQGRPVIENLRGARRDFLDEALEGVADEEQARCASSRPGAVEYRRGGKDRRSIMKEGAITPPKRWSPPPPKAVSKPKKKKAAAHPDAVGAAAHRSRSAAISVADLGPLRLDRQCLCPAGHGLGQRRGRRADRRGHGPREPAGEAGDLLFRIDPRPFRIALAQAEAQIAAAQVQVNKLEAESAGTGADIQGAGANLGFAQRAFERQAELLRRGFTTRARYWVEANFKESDLAKMASASPPRSASTPIRAQAQGPCRQHRRRHRQRILGAPGAERQRQLGQGDPARAGADRVRRQSRADDRRPVGQRRHRRPRRPAR